MAFECCIINLGGSQLLKSAVHCDVTLTLQPVYRISEDLCKFMAGFITLQWLYLAAILVENVQPVLVHVS